MKVLVCGDRNWDNSDVIKMALERLKVSSIIEGECKGADILGKEVALELGLTIQGVQAEWSIYGRGAGPIRNSAMLNFNPDMVVAFHDDIWNSKGTKNMITQSLGHGVKVRLYKSDRSYLEIEGVKEWESMLEN